MFRLTCIVCCLGLFRHAKPCCMSTLVCTCMSLRKITKTYKEIHATWTHIACIWMKPNANLLFSSVLSGLHNSKLWNKHEILRQCKGLAPLYHLLLCWIDIFLLHTSFIHGFICDLWFSSGCLTLNGLRLIVLLKHFDSELADKSAVNIIRFLTFL